MKLTTVACAAVLTLAPIAVAAGTERVHVIVNNASPQQAHIELIGADRKLEEFDLGPGRSDRRMVNIATPARVRFFSTCALPHPTTETLDITNSRTTLGIYVLHNCKLNIVKQSN
jgi:hypothetical protein